MWYLNRNVASVKRERFYGVVVSTLDFESSDPSSNPGRTLTNILIIITTLINCESLKVFLNSPQLNKFKFFSQTLTFFLPITDPRLGGRATYRELPGRLAREGDFRSPLSDWRDGGRRGSAFSFSRTFMTSSSRSITWRSTSPAVTGRSLVLVRHLRRSCSLVGFGAIIDVIVVVCAGSCDVI